jgi:hypothetical protein
MLSSHERVALSNSSSRVIKVYENYSKVLTYTFSGNGVDTDFEIPNINILNCVTEVRDGQTNSIVLTDVHYDTSGNRILVRIGSPLEVGESLKVIVTTKVN